MYIFAMPFVILGLPIALLVTFLTRFFRIGKSSPSVPYGEGFAALAKFIDLSFKAGVGVVICLVVWACYLLF